MAFGGNVGGLVTSRDINVPPGATVVNQGDGVQRPSVSESDLESDLQYSNRVATGSQAKSPYFQYAYVEAETNPISSEEAPLIGGNSLFNEYAIFVSSQTANISDFFDNPGEEGLFPKYTKPNGQDGRGGRYLTASSLVEDSPPFGVRDGKSPTPYAASDFIFSKHYKKVPLNHLITLRRFPFPTYDSLEFDGENTYKPIAQAITYFGESTENKLEDLTKFSGFINWREMEAEINDVPGEERGFSETPFMSNLSGANANVNLGGGRKASLSGNTVASGLKYGNALTNQGREAASGRAAESQERQRLLGDPNYTNEVLGPVNVVNKTHIRERGLGADLELDLVFEYKLRSFSGINPRVAMVDLICNMLSLTFNNAKFWGGANRYFPKVNQFGFIGDQQKFYDGDYKGFIDSFVTQLGDGLGTGISALKGLMGNILSGNLSGIGDALGGAGSALFDLQSGKSRPNVLGFRAILTGLPVGEWHVTVGNPYRPIMMIGNLICTNFEFHMGGPLGADDMPTELKFNIKLKGGRSRDKGDVESTLNFGQGRIYHPPSGLNTDPSNASASTGTRVKPNNGSNANNPSKSTSTSSTATPTSSPKVKSRGSKDAEYLKKMTGSVF